MFLSRLGLSLTLYCLTLFCSLMLPFLCSYSFKHPSVPFTFLPLTLYFTLSLFRFPLLSYIALYNYVDSVHMSVLHTPLPTVE